MGPVAYRFIRMRPEVAALGGPAEEFKSVQHGLRLTDMEFLFLYLAKNLSRMLKRPGMGPRETRPSPYLPGSKTKDRANFVFVLKLFATCRQRKLLQQKTSSCIEHFAFAKAQFFFNLQ